MPEPLSEADRCHWPTGTARTGPRTCNRPAKTLFVVAVAPWDTVREGDDMPVCGIHRNLIRRSWPQFFDEGGNEEWGDTDA